MKKLIFASQLDLGKEIIANLSDEQLREIEGGNDSGGSCQNQTSGGPSCPPPVIVVPTAE
jgi:hypothetical protein